MKLTEPRKVVGGYLVLPLEFSEKGFNFKQISRQGDVAIYGRAKDKTKPHFEVIVIKRHESYTIAENTIEAAEMYPSSEQWGTTAWSYNTIEEANKRFKTLL